MIRALQINSEIIAEVEIDHLQGEPALGSFGFRFNIRLHRKMEGLELSNFMAFISVYFPQHQSRIEYKLGSFLFQRRLLGLTLNTNECQLFLTPYQLTEIEKQRNGGDLTFKVKMSCLVDGFKNKDTMEGTAEFEIEVNQKKWLLMLKQMNYTDFMLLEIPIPVLDNASSFRNIVVRYRKVNESMINGEYTQAVSECRTVLEGLEKKFKINLKAARKAYGDNPKLMKLTQRIDLLLDSAKHATHLGHHPNEEEGEDLYTEYSRSQAQLIVGTTGLILSYLMNQEKLKNG